MIDSDHVASLVPLTRCLVAVAALGLAVVPGRSSAQSRSSGPPALQSAAAEQPLHFGGSIGLAMPTGDISNAVNMGFNLTGLIEYKLRNSPVSLRGELVYHHFGLKSDELNGITGGSANTIGATADIVLTVPGTPGSVVHPYAIGGLGLYHIGSHADSFLGSVDLGSQTKLGLNAGVGVEFRMHRATTFVEVRYHTVFTDGFSTSFVPLTVGIKL